MTQPQRPRAVNVVVATTVMLSFISFWRAAAIVLSDLASSAYYVGGIAEQAIGKAAPWFILAIMLFSYAVRAIYIESCSMFVRGGVYKVVHEAMGGTLAKFSVSALMFDYVLTGPISAVSAGLYLGGLINETGEYLKIPGMHVYAPYFAAVFAAAVTVYFWRKNIIGIHESSEKALRIMQITTVMVVILIGWCLITIFKNGYQPVPLPVLANLHFSKEGLGWLRGTAAPSITIIAIMVGLGHSLLAMSGEESLAQVNREIAHPKLKNLERAGFVIFIYSMLFTSLVSFFAVMIIPDAARPKFLNNLIGGLAMFLVGPMSVRLLFHAFVVLVGTLILAGAVNTAIIGSNGVLNRVAEDGVLPDWFRHPHTKYGTTSRIINLLVILQLVTIVISRGDVYMLGEAYAFGVVWSFFLKSMGVLVLRYHRHDQEYKVPFNFYIGKTEIPVGLVVTTLTLGLVAIANLFSKQIATIYGVSFTTVFFIIFTISERVNAKRRAASKGASGLEEFNLDMRPEITSDSVHARPGCVLVAVRDYHHMTHLQSVLEKTNLRRHDIVVMTVRPISSGAGEYHLSNEQLFSDYEKELLTRVVSMAEKEGKTVDLLVVPGVDPFDAMVQTASKLGASRLVTGVSPRMDSEELARRIGMAWERLPEPRHPFSLEIITPDRPSIYVNLGPHPPRLWPEDLDRAHDLWLRLTESFGSRLHHRDVVGVALRRLENDLNNGDRKQEVIDDLNKELRH